MRGMASPGSREKDGRHRNKNRGCTENAGENAEGGGKYSVAAVREHRSYPQSFPDAPRRGFAVQETHDVRLARSQTKAQDKRCNGERPERRKKRKDRVSSAAHGKGEYQELPLGEVFRHPGHQKTHEKGRRIENAGKPADFRCGEPYGVAVDREHVVLQIPSHGDKRRNDENVSKCRYLQEIPRGVFLCRRLGRPERGWEFRKRYGEHQESCCREA